MTATKSNQERETAVEAFLLQQHQARLQRLVISRIFYRAVCLANVSFVVLVNRFSLIQTVASASVAFWIAVLWYYERQNIFLLLSSLEQSLAQRSGDDWEDFYIRWRYQTSKSTKLSDRAGLILVRLEPLLWLLLILALVSLRIYLEKANVL